MNNKQTNVKLNSPYGSKLVDLVASAEAHDVKGLCAQARRGEIKGFTSIDDSYEALENPKIVLQAVGRTPEERARSIMTYLEERELLNHM